MIDKTRLAKILAMTTSSNDHEALAAVRRANEIVRAEGGWEAVLGVARPIGEVRWQHRGENRPRPDHDDHVRNHVLIDSMFGFVIPKLDIRQELSVAMVRMRADWKANGYLTRTQFSVLEHTFQFVRQKRSAGG